MFPAIRRLFLTALFLAGGALYAAEDTAASSTQAAGFAFTDTHGQSFHITETPEGLSYPEFKDKAVFAIFYIHTGTPCRNELQLLSKLKPKLPEMEIVAFELKGLKPDQLKAFEEELKLRGIHMIDTAQAMPFANFIAQKAGWQGSVPLIILTDKKGAVRHMQLGAMNAEEIEAYYKKISG